MNVGKVGTVYRKELLDMLRDRRTLFTTILLPILLFPLLMGGLIGWGIFLGLRVKRQVAAVMLLGAEQAPTLAQRLRAWKEKGEEQEAFQIVPASDDYVERINDKRLRAAVEFPPGLQEKLRSAPEEPQTLQVYHFEGEFSSQITVRRIQRAVRAYRDELVEARLDERGLSTKILEPFNSEKSNVAPPEQVTGNILGMILPYLIIVLSVMGALYPAIDLTAGEKERGTLETILASPVSRLELVGGKFLLVLTASLATTALAIGSLALTLLAGADLIGRLTEGFVIAVSAKAAATVFFILLPLAVTFSAGLLAVAVVARNYREAQSYTGPLLIVVILPAVASLIPGLELDARMALVPILNVSLIAKEIFAGQYPWTTIGLIFASTCVYAAAALGLAAWQFKREAVLFRV